MFVYFDSNGTLKEIISDKTFRVGDSKRDKIYIYWEGEHTPISGWVKYRKPNKEETKEKTFFQINDKLVAKELPTKPLRNLKYFSYDHTYTDENGTHAGYEFYEITVPDEVLSSYSGDEKTPFENNMIIASVRFVLDEYEIIALGAIVFSVETNIGILTDSSINETQYNYLVELLSTKLSYNIKSEKVDVLPTAGEINTIYYVRRNQEDIVYDVYYWTGTEFAFLGFTSYDLYTKVEGEDFENAIQALWTAEFNDYKSLINKDISDFESTLNDYGSLIDNLSNGGPKGVYSSLNALKNNNPDHKYIYLVLEDGYWYYWNLSSNDWARGGKYLTMPLPIEAEDISYIPLLGGSIPSFNVQDAIRYIDIYKADKTYVTKQIGILKDQLFDIVARTYEEDIATDSYSVPSNFDGHSLIESVPCEVKSIKGNSVAFNQLVQNNASSQTLNGVVITKNTNGSYTFSGTATANIRLSICSLSLVSRRKYLLKGVPNGASSTTGGYRLFIDNLGNQVEDKIINNTYNGNADLKVSIDNGASVDFTTFIQFHDLHLMGLDSITSVEEFKAKYPLDYYAYDSGSIKSVSVSKIESWGYNLFTGTFEKFSNGQYIRSNTFIRVIGGQTYSFDDNGFTDYQFRHIVQFDKDKNEITDIYKGTYDVPQGTEWSLKLEPNTAYIKLQFAYWESQHYANLDVSTIKPCFHLTGSLTGYKPYVGKLGTITLPTITTIDGVNSVKDTLTFEEQANGTYNAIITRRVGVVDLGTLDWDLGTSLADNLFFATISNINPPSSSVERNNGILSSKYPVSATTSLNNNMSDKSMLRHASNIYIKDTSYTDTTTFKTAMSGIMLYYELATPTTEVIATGLTYEQVSIAFGIGGTIINDNENTEYNAQATTTIDFACKDWSIQ